MSASDSRSSEVVGVSIGLLVTSTLFTITRFLTRIFVVRNFGPEDWTIGLATVRTYLKLIRDFFSANKHTKIFSLALTVCLNERRFHRYKPAQTQTHVTS